jgi:hypothetical protein
MTPGGCNTHILEPKGIAMKVQSYLSFEGRCDEALGFYKKALGAEVVQPSSPPASAC